MEEYQFKVCALHLLSSLLNSFYVNFILFIDKFIIPFFEDSFSFMSDM